MYKLLVWNKVEKKYKTYGNYHTKREAEQAKRGAYRTLHPVTGEPFAGEYIIEGEKDLDDDGRPFEN